MKSWRLKIVAITWLHGGHQIAPQYRNTGLPWPSPRRTRRRRRPCARRCRRPRAPVRPAQCRRRARAPLLRRAADLAVAAGSGDFEQARSPTAAVTTMTCANLAILGSMIDRRATGRGRSVTAIIVGSGDSFRHADRRDSALSGRSSSANGALLDQPAVVEDEHAIEAPRELGAAQRPDDRAPLRPFAARRSARALRTRDRGRRSAR